MKALDYSNYMRDNFQATELSIAQRKSIFGFGVNDADYNTQQRVNGIKNECPAYRAWVSIIRRSKSGVYLSSNSSYFGVSVANEWSSFMAFRRWWIDHQVDGWHLDKDLLFVGNTEYSPHKCVYVPQWLNNFSTLSEKSRGALMVGVSRRESGKFRARCGNPITGKDESLGHFASEIDAHNAWLERKIDITNQIKPVTDAIDGRIHGNLIKIFTCAT